MSLTVTVNMQLAVLPLASVAVHVTVVVPFGKADPDAGLHVAGQLPPSPLGAMGFAPFGVPGAAPQGQLSVTVGAG